MIIPALRLTLLGAALFAGLLGARGAAPARVTIDTAILEGFVDSSKSQAEAD